MTENATPAAGTDTAAAPAATETKTEAQIVADVMAFDPFAPPAEKPAEAGTDTTGKEELGGQGGEVKPVEGKEPTQQVDPKATAATAQAPQQQGPTPREQELLAQVSALQHAIARSQPQPQAQPQGQPQGQAPKYNLQLPPQIIKGLRSEDDEEFAVAMHAVMNGIVNKVWNDVQEHLVKEVQPGFDRRIQSAMEHNTQIKRIHDDFYGTYPHLANPAIRPVVQNAAMQVAQAWTMQGRPIQWTKEFADSVAMLVHQIIPAPQQQQQSQPQIPGKTPTFTSQPGTRPAATPINDFASVL